MGILSGLTRPSITLGHLGYRSFETTSGALEAYVQELTPDCVVVSRMPESYRHDSWPRCRFVNVHYAPLPRYRGRANVNWAIINHEPFAGITIHTISPGLMQARFSFKMLSQFRMSIMLRASMKG